jgi:hypothetical protein
VRRLLGKGNTLASVSNWADHVRTFGRPETASWHFIDIPIRERVTKHDIEKFCPNRDCVVEQIKLALLIIRSASTTAAYKAEALKFLVHFVGDLHQPLHCADDHDRGGNLKLVRYQSGRGRGVKIKLHAFWDRLASPKVIERARPLATRLRLRANERAGYERGDVDDWAWESHQLARDVVYAGFAQGPTSASDGVALPAAYYGPRVRDIALQQLQRAGARLAKLLNESLVP